MIIVKFAPELRPVLKHATHDQQSHGNWAGGGLVTDLNSWNAAASAKFGSQDEKEAYLLDNILSQRMAGFTGREYYPAVNAYQSTYGYTINEALRDPNITTGQVQPWIDGLDKAIKDAPPLASDTTVYRGVTGEGLGFFESLNTNDVFQDKGFASTTLDTDVATKFATKTAITSPPFPGETLQLPDSSTGIVMRINLSKGTKGVFPTSVTGLSSLSSREAEFLLPRDSKFRILSNQGKVWDVEVVND